MISLLLVQQAASPSSSASSASLHASSCVIWAKTFYFTGNNTLVMSYHKNHWNYICKAPIKQDLLFVCFVFRVNMLKVGPIKKYETKMKHESFLCAIQWRTQGGKSLSCSFWTSFAYCVTNSLSAEFLIPMFLCTSFNPNLAFFSSFSFPVSHVCYKTNEQHTHSTLHTVGDKDSSFIHLPLYSAVWDF